MRDLELAPSPQRLKSVELFGGAGGLALGLHAAGFDAELFVEQNAWACSTVRLNAAAGFKAVQDWTVLEADVRTVDWHVLPSGIDLVSGGPPCQPFSLGGRARAADDPRDMFPSVGSILNVLAPRAFVLENVRGLLRPSFAEYLELVVLRLRYPEIISRRDESSSDHLSRLRKVAGAKHGRFDGLEYEVSVLPLDAADFGVPQRRHRVFVVGFRKDVEGCWVPPSPTHSLDSLLYSQWVDGSYWEENEVALGLRPDLDPRLQTRVARLRMEDSTPARKRWRTVRDTIRDLPEPELTSHPIWNDHRLQPGARVYRGHSGSRLDEPAKALKAGGHGVPGGENMLTRADGTVRYFSVRESARLQGFPDEYLLHGSWGTTMRQLGNAVPPLLAEVVGRSVAHRLLKDQSEGAAV